MGGFTSSCTCAVLSRHLLSIRNVSYSIFSEPSKPGALQLSNSKLNATDESITLVWNASYGKVSEYLLQVFDVDIEKYHTLVAAPQDNAVSTTVTFLDMKNGYKYNVSITAKSLQFEGDNTVDSDIYTEQIKTVVMRKYSLHFSTLHAG